MIQRIPTQLLWRSASSQTLCGPSRGLVALAHSARKLRINQRLTQQHKPSNSRSLTSQSDRKPPPPGPYFQDALKPHQERPNTRLHQPHPTAYFQPAPKPKYKRTFRPYGYALAALIIGYVAGGLIEVQIFNESFPEPGTPEDMLAITTVGDVILPKIAQLQWFRDQPEWEEFDPYEGEEESSPERMTVGALARARGVGVYHRVFRSPSGEFMTVLFVGPGLSGWPGVAHGGFVATIMGEAAERTAAYALGKEVELAKLEVKYSKPVLTVLPYAIYSVRMTEVESDSNSMWVYIFWQDLDQKTFAEARALVVRRGADFDVEGAKWSKVSGDLENQPVRVDR